jgi:hypothetical protein
VLRDGRNSLIHRAMAKPRDARGKFVAGVFNYVYKITDKMRRVEEL